MTRQRCDGAGLLSAFRAGVANLEAHVEQVNAMNVFPVPDGDTGSNMVATARAALAEAERAADPRAGLFAAAFSRGALLGAQGNSGVIASQIARGLAEALAGKQHIDGRDIAGALTRGADTAYAAVAEPVEGTILTVIRDAGNAARAACAVSDDPVAVLRAAVDAAESSVARTPALLSVLRDAGVADAGGEGLYLLLAGALDSLDGATPRRPRIETIARPHRPAAIAQEFGFETMFRLEAAPGRLLDIAGIRLHLGSIGHSVVVAGDTQAATVHVHGTVPEEVLAYAGRLGTLSRITVEDLDRKAREVLEHETGESTAPAAPGAGPTVIALVSGDGFAALLESLGATVIRADGHGHGADVGALRDMIDGAPAGDVLIVPGDSAVLVAAEEAARLSDRPVWVVPARNAAEAAAAMLALDGSREPGTIAAAMTAAAGRIQTIAVSDAADSIRTALAGVEALAPGFELVTIYHGAAVHRDRAEELRRSIVARLPGVEVEVVRGGQIDSLYLIAAE